MRVEQVREGLQIRQLLEQRVRIVLRPGLTAFAMKHVPFEFEQAGDYRRSHVEAIGGAACDLNDGDAPKRANACRLRLDEILDELAAEQQQQESEHQRRDEKHAPPRAGAVTAQAHERTRGAEQQRDFNPCHGGENWSG